MYFKFLDIVPREHGVWAILFVPYFAGTFASEAPRFPALLLLICIISIFLLRGCVEFYLSNIIKKKESYKNINTFYLNTLFIFVLFILTTIPLLFYFKLWNLLILGFSAFSLIGLYYLLNSKKEMGRIPEQFIIFSALTLSGPAAYYVSTGMWDMNAFTIWVVNLVFFQLGMLYVHGRMGLHKKRKQITGPTDKLKLAKNLLTGWCVSLVIFCGLFFAGLIKPVFFIILIPMTIHIIVGIFIDKKELKVKRMGYSLLGQDIFFLIMLIYLFRSY